LSDQTDIRRLHGSWALVSWERFRGGAFLEHPLGPDPVGLITYDPIGCMQVQMIARGRGLSSYRNPRDAANAALRGQALPAEFAAEAARAYSTFAGYAGRYEVDEANSVIRHHVWSGIDPRMVDGVQERLYKIVDDDTLILEIRPYMVDGVEHGDTLVWRRIKSMSRPHLHADEQVLGKD